MPEALMSAIGITWLGMKSAARARLPSLMLLWIRMRSIAGASNWSKSAPEGVVTPATSVNETIDGAEKNPVGIVVLTTAALVAFLLTVLSLPILAITSVPLPS
jgi:hypothetical protein